MTKNLTLKLALILVVLLNFTQLLQQTITDLFNLITNSNLMELLPLAVSSTMAIISLILSPILISLEIKDMSNRKLKDPTNIVSILKIILLSAAMLISASSLLGFQLPVILLSTIPLAGILLATCGLLYQIATKFNKAQNYKQKTAYLFLGMLILGLSSLAFLGALSVTAALVVLIGVFIFNTATRSKGFSSDVKTLLKEFDNKKQDKAQAKELTNDKNKKLINDQDKDQEKAQDQDQEKAQDQDQEKAQDQDKDKAQAQELTNDKNKKLINDQDKDQEKAQDQDQDQDQVQVQENNTKEQAQDQLIKNISYENKIQDLETQVKDLQETVKNLRNEIKTLEQSQTLEFEESNKSSSSFSNT